jgi:hypothetical protein
MFLPEFIVHLMGRSAEDKLNEARWWIRWPLGLALGALMFVVIAVLKELLGEV